MQYPVIHIVKRFGRVGGMESYVWHLVHGLAGRGIKVIILCEQVCESPVEDVRIINVESSSERPRWKSMMTFRTRVNQKIREVFSGQEVLIHSHERSLCHQVTTFHGPPIDPPTGFEWLSLVNRRFIAWKQMECDELFGPNVQMVLPVSSQIEKQLMHRYSQIVDKKIDLAWPGVHRPQISPNGAIPTDPDYARFVFVGNEWKRKGLDIAIRIVEEFRKSQPRATLTVFGTDHASVPWSLCRFDWVIFKGWSSCIPWWDFDALLHPARKEPFGMVVAEARSHGIPVVMSSEVGARDLQFSATKILDVSAPPVKWCQELAELIATKNKSPELKWIWGDLVDKHIETIYPQLESVVVATQE